MTHFNDIAKLYALRPSGHGLCALAPSLRGKHDEAGLIDLALIDLALID